MTIDTPYLPIIPGINMAVMDVDLNSYDDDKMKPLQGRVKALEDAAAKANGHEIEIQVRQFPEDKPEEEFKAICWRYKKIGDEPDFPWQLLCYESELKGPQGDEGPAGEHGKGLEVHGSVNHQNDLTKAATYATLGITTPIIGDVMVVVGRDEAWLYKGPVDHKPAPGQEGWQFITNWHNLGKIAGIVGPVGPRGPKGSSGSSIGMMIISIMISSAISIATSSIMFDVEMMVNDAINDAMMAAEGAMEDIAQSAIEKAIDEAGEQFKGKKGDKGEDGEPGKDGRSCQIVGKYDALYQFQIEYPLVSANVGKAALITNDHDHTSELWAITEGHIGTVKLENFGDIRGPQGDPSEWTISFRDTDFVPKLPIIVVPSDLPTGVAGMYIQDSDSIIVNGTSGSSESSRQVGFQMNMRYPIPPLYHDGGFHTPTTDKFLSNNGHQLEWVDIDLDTGVLDELKLKSPDGTVFVLTVDNNGRLKTTPETV